MEELGRLKKTLSKKCPFCLTTLQLRVRENNILIKGENVISDYEYEYCHKCETETEVESKISRKKKWAEIPVIPEPEPVYKKRDWKKKS